MFHPDEETVISCVFDELPAEITLEDAVTSFSGEYLLNTDGKLEIWKSILQTENKRFGFMLIIHLTMDLMICYQKRIAI